MMQKCWIYEYEKVIINNILTKYLSTLKIEVSWSEELDK